MPVVLSIIIVNYNVKYFVEQCVNSILHSEGIDLGRVEVFVVDNASKDGSLKYLRQQFAPKRFPNVHIIGNKRNVGFGRANNLALKKAQGKYVLFLNPDTLLTEHTLADVLAQAEQTPHLGALGVRMLLANGAVAKESRRGLPSPWASFCKMAGLTALFPKSKLFGRYYMGYLPWDKPSQIDIVSGAFMFASAEALGRVGAFDEDFFMYGEDIDLSYSLLKGGYQNGYVPTSMVHYKGESTTKNSYRYVHVFYEAMLIFFKKHYRHYGMLLSFPIMLAIVLRAALALVVQQGQALRKFLFPHPDTKPRRMLYIGRSADMVKQIAEEYGLDMDFYNADEQRLPEGHLSSCLKSTDYEHIIYDTDDFSRAFILERFRENPLPRVFMGTFNPQRGVIVTVSHVYNS